LRAVVLERWRPSNDRARRAARAGPQSVGVWTVVGVCIARSWAPHLSAEIALVGMAAGLATALLASVVPALRASAVGPAQGLRQ